jgi:ribonuclease P protein component
MPDERFPPAARLHTRRDYGRVFGRSQRGYGRFLTVMLSRRPESGDQRARLGVVVSLKVSKLAVRRHQLKRWARELFRRRLQHELPGWDLVIMLRHDPLGDGAAFNAEVEAALQRARDTRVVTRRKPGRRDAAGKPKGPMVEDSDP